jgi:hypothetical protein
LDSALEWDQIPAVNFRRPEDEFVYDSHNLEKLRALSQSRQKTFSEFLYLQENISWFRKKRETKTLSLNLAKRISQKKSDEEVSKALQNTFNSLAPKAFPLRKAKLKVVRDQTQKSLKARGEDGITEEESNKKLEKPKALDIRLHESVRIMVDWLDMLEGEQLSQQNLPDWLRNYLRYEYEEELARKQREAVDP